MRYIALALLLTSAVFAGEPNTSLHVNYPANYQNREAADTMSPLLAKVERAEKTAPRKQLPVKKELLQRTEPLKEQDFLNESHLNNVPVAPIPTTPAAAVSAPRAFEEDFSAAPATAPTAARSIRRPWPLNADDQLPDWWPNNQQLVPIAVMLFFLYLVIKCIKYSFEVDE